MEERIQKIMAAAGIASRRAAEEIILEGRVKVNGAVVTELGAKADPDKDHIKVDGKLINPKQPKTYIMLNKPTGCVTTMFDPEGRPTVTSLLKGVKTRVYPVGRLDYDTEGLLLLTNDGDFAFRVTHPSHELPKTYHVKIKGVLEDRQIESLEQGVFLKDGKTAPARVKKLRKEEANSWVEITIHEGRKRQVRRMIDYTGHSVIKLKRVRIGDLHIGDLPLGTFRHLTSDEVNLIKDSALGGDSVFVETAKPVRRPAAAAHVPDFIEGPKPGVRPRKKAASARTGASTYRAAAPAARRPSRPQEGREGAFEKKPWRPVQRDERQAGRGARPGEKRFERPSSGQDRPFSDRPATRERTSQRPEGTGFRREEKRFDKPSFGGKSRPFQERGPRADERSRPRTGTGRSFGDRPAPRERSERRPEGAGVRRDAPRLERPSFGGKPRAFQDRGPRTDERSRQRTGPGRSFGDRPASREPRFDKPSFSGKSSSFQDRGPRTEGLSRPRTGPGRSFGDRPAPRDRAERRPAGERPWKDSRPAGRPAFGSSAGSRPGPRPARPESRGPRPEGRTGGQRDSGARRPSGEGSRPPMRRSASAPQGRPQGPRRSGPRPTGGSGRPKGPGIRRS
ncbi:MAG: pseudouridine synthase [Nitrospirota bacterium]